MHLHRAVAGQVAPDPFTIVVAEGGTGDDREALLAEPGDGEVALDPATRVEHLGVGDLPDLAGDLVVAEPFEQAGRAGPGDLHLREGGLVEDRRGLAAGRVLGPDRGRPVLARPPARAQPAVAAAAFASYQFTRSQPDFSPKAASCSRCQALAGDIRSGRPAWRSCAG